MDDYTTLGNLESPVGAGGKFPVMNATHLYPQKEDTEEFNSEEEEEEEEEEEDWEETHWGEEKIPVSSQEEESDESSHNLT